MTQEQKAKAYDEALERAKKWYDANTNEGYRGIFDDIFPEFKESEDEKSKKWILEYLHDGLRKSDEQFKDHFKAAIAWLEKQGEQKPIEEYNITGIGSKNAKGKLGEMIKNLKPVNEVLEQKLTWSEEDEEKFNEVIDFLDYKGHKTDIEFLKSLKDRIQPKQEWSEDDTEMLDYIIRYIEVDKNNDTIRTKKMEVLEGMTEWLKSLKDMCIQQPEQEWSDDDAGFCARIQGILNVCKSHNLLSPDLCKEMCDWLKSLRPQNRWKPSDEQMDALHYVTNFDYGGHKSTLVSLYEQLKKLK